MNWIHAFLRGMARIVYPTIGRAEIERIVSRTDREALAADWKAVGDDLRKVMR